MSKRKNKGTSFLARSKGVLSLNIPDMNFEILMWDQVIGRVWIDYSTLPPKVTVEQYETDPLLRMFLTDTPGIEEVVDLFESRCFPRTRVNAGELLSSLGLKVYDPISIIKKTRGIQQEDTIWFRFEGEELSYADISVRDWVE